MDTLTPMLTLTPTNTVDYNDVDNYEMQQTYEKKYKVDAGNTYLVVESSEQYLDGEESSYETDGMYHLYAGANEVFFTSESGSRMCVFKQKNNDELNNGTQYSHITNMRSNADGLYWAFLSDRNISTMYLNAYMELDPSITLQNVPRLEVFVDNYKVDFNVSNEDDKYIFSIKVDNLNAGFHTLRILIKSNPSKKSIGNFYYVKFSSYTPLYLVRDRWRPKAIYGQFRAKGVDQANVRSLVFSQSAHPESFNVYCPFMAPFGYTGTGNGPNGPSGKNFSLWTKKQGQSDPPRYQWSRLLGIGNEFAEFSMFTHEGTGVKPRKFNPWETNTSNNTVCGLHMVTEPSFGGFLTTFYDYYWDESVNEWKIFAIGQKWDENPPLMRNNCFIEVLGGGDKQRSSNNKRKIYYVVHTQTTDGKWHKCNILGNEAQKEFVHHERGIENGKFFLSTGGLVQYKRTVSTPLTLPAVNPEVLPLYMQPDKIKVIGEPVEFPKVVNATINKDTKKLNLAFNTGNSIGTPRRIEVHYGYEDGLTIDRYWQYSATAKLNEKGENNMSFNVTLEDNNNPVLLRILIVSSTMQLWSVVTTSVLPTVVDTPTIVLPN
jgi:hypothetical protein